MSIRCFSAQQIILADGGDGPGWLTTRGDRIEETGRGDPPVPADEVIEGWLVPGFVDIHCHGGGGASFDSGDPDQILTAVAAHRKHGTTSQIASLVSAHKRELLDQVRILADMCDDDAIAGIHLEGPWLSPAQRGAHDPTCLRDPSIEELDQLLIAGRGHVRMVTFAPEREAALATIRFCVANGVVAAIGHTEASYNQVVQAIDAGATVATHLFNAMTPMKPRQAGPIPALTESPRVTVELIIDGIHMTPPAARLAERATGGRIVLITDAMAAAGSEDGMYRLGDLSVKVVDGVARLVDSGKIAGSTLTMDSAFRRLVKACSASVLEASRAASVRGARLMGLSDRGELVPGAHVDMCELDEHLTLIRSWRNGQVCMA